MNSKTKVFIIDTSAILSGKPINLGDAQLVTTPAVSQEFKPGGRDYRIFQLIQEKGLTILSPSKESITQINMVALKTGDHDRLSSADREILALALDIHNDPEKDVTILTDDYSIQNVAYVLHLKFEGFAQKGITKKFKWTYRCRGCGEKFKENIKICPICGAAIKNIISSKENIEKK